MVIPLLTGARQTPNHEDRGEGIPPQLVILSLPTFGRITTHVGYVLCKLYRFRPPSVFVGVFPLISPSDCVWMKQVQHENKGLTSYYSCMLNWEE